MVTTEIVDTAEELERIETEWETLTGESFTAIFSSPAWHRAWLEAFPPKRIALVTARERGRLVGVLPLSLIRSDIRGLYFPLVTPIARGDYQPPIVVSDCACRALPVMLDTALRHFGRRVVYWFPNVPATDPALQVLLSSLQKLGMVYTTTTDIAPRLRIGGRSYAEIEAGWSARRRKEVRRKRRRLEALGDLSLWRPRTLEEARALTWEFFAVHDEKWLSQGHPGRFHDPAYRRHFLALVERLWDRGLHLSALRCGSTNVYYSFSFGSGGWILLYRPAFRIEYFDYSPGTVFLSLLIEQACRTGLEGIDFLLGSEEFKFHWSNDTLDVVSVHAASSAWSFAFQWFARGKPYFIKHLEPTMARAKAQWQRVGARRTSASLMERVIAQSGT